MMHLRARAGSSMCAGFEVWQPRVRSVRQAGRGQALGHVEPKEEESIEDRRWLAGGPLGQLRLLLQARL